MGNRVSRAVAMASTRRTQAPIYETLKALPPTAGMPLAEPYQFGLANPDSDPPACVGPRGSATYQAWQAGVDAGRLRAVDRVAPIAITRRTAIGRAHV